ncbi:zinc ABC transporter ATP-binding protein ZnuC [Vibrio sp. MA40-2]|uniref:zinc ABC transporter ATP-binding protein ZnuC n=1 Tax=Vibrio sp. MA40-2 TaxID=3391828 RepID=UPI0039A63900
MSLLVSMKDICVRFDNRDVLKNISLDIYSNEITTIIGPNGAGKSTLIKTILNLVTPDKGEIKKKKKLTVGYVPQKLKLNETLPLHVDRFLKLAGKYNQQQRTEALQLVGATHLATNDMHRLSGGENQRVLLARALLRRPELLVLDEPAQGVDVQGQIELYNLVETIRHRFGCAVLMISHDLHLVMAKTDKVVCINHHICCSGEPESISTHPSYVELFGQQAKHSLAVYHHSHQDKHDLSGYPASQQDCCSEQQEVKHNHA